MSRAPNPRFVVGIGEKRKNDEDSILFVADILRDNVVREHKIVSAETKYFYWKEEDNFY